jgi:hypothetical protein
MSWLLVIVYAAFGGNGASLSHSHDGFSGKLVQTI